MNLAFLGFSVAAIVFGAYSYTFYRLTEKKLPPFLKSYALAYFALALAFLTWALASLNNNLLDVSVIIGNVFLLIGSLLLLAVLLNNNPGTRKQALTVGALLALVFLYLRVTYYWPTPFMLDGVMVFNTQKAVALVLGLIFITIWLPASLFVAKQVTAKTEAEDITFVFSLLYSVSTVAAILFMAFKTPALIITTFVILLVCFTMLLYSNYVINKLHH